MTVKSNSSFVALLGDVVDSRRVGDRGALHTRLVAALADVDAVVPSRGGLRVTVGDEFQGVYDSLGAALDAALRLRLLLLPLSDVRIGLGRGAIVTLDEASGLQDGPAWWAARQGVEQVEQQSRKAALRALRTAYVLGEGAQEPAAVAAAVNAALACQDHLMESWSARSVRLLAGLLEGQTQAQLAHQEQISASAVSQQVRSRGIGVVRYAHDELRRLP